MSRLKRPELIAAVNQSLRQMSTATVLFHQAIADSLGMNVTDHKCAGLLLDEGSCTAGELADKTGLTTGAITGVIDRLEKAGFARRTRAANDRRKIVVEPIVEAIQHKMAPLFASMAQSASELCGNYSSAELEVIRDFINKGTNIAVEETQKLRSAKKERVVSGE